MKRGHQPQRTCLGCGVRDDQQRLLRLVLHEGELIARQRGSGRGGYLHKQAECWEAFLRRKNLYRTFHTSIERHLKEKFVQTLRGQHS